MNILRPLLDLLVAVMFAALIQGAELSSLKIPELYKGKSVFHFCVEKGYTALVSGWLESPANVVYVNVVEPRLHETPLFAAIRNKNVQMVQLLVSHGARIDTTNKNGLTPINVAQVLAHQEIIELLLKPAS